MEPEKLSLSPIVRDYKPWAMAVPAVFEFLHARLEGLDEREAAERMRQYGPNTIRTKRRNPKLKIIMNQIKSPLIVGLIIAGAITVFLHEWVDAAAIAAAVLVNAVLGFYQENKAETVLELLKSYVRTRARVRRAGGEREVDAEELVPGDVIRVTQGDRVPADARVIFANGFRVDESVLTGESLPVKKNEQSVLADAPLAERSSSVLGGTLAVEGFVDAVVTATGSDTEFGRIAALVAENEHESTPLQESITRLTVRAGILVGALIVTLFGVGVYYDHDVFEMFLIAVAVAVSAVPEGLPVAMTVILAVGVQRLAGRRGIVRRLLAAETLGSTSIIMTDKTGTLTQAKMELANVIPHTGTTEEDKIDVIRLALTNADVVIENPDDAPSAWRLFGRHAIEVSLLRGAAVRGVLYPQLQKSIRVIERLPFSSVYKYSASAFVEGEKTRIVLVGAPEIILKFTTLSEEERTHTQRLINELASQGERIVGVASGVVTSAEKKFAAHEFKDLKFAGLLVFSDPLRVGVREAVRRIGEAGVRTVIVTGDHKGTAEAIARELGMLEGGKVVCGGDELAAMSPEELERRAPGIAAYARVTPEQKVMLARFYKKRGDVVAMTGDGVNDAPALQEADIGVAIGSGTDVAKGAADLIILDDNFETIVAAIEEGRRILDNIRKVIVYLLSDGLDELLLIGGSLIAGVTLPLSALQILFVNFFSDSFPAIALAFEKGVDNLGTAPRSLDRNLFDKAMRFQILIIGASTSALLLVLYLTLLRLGFDEELVRTFIFASFATYTLFLVFSLRSLERGILRYNPFSNPYLVWGVGFGLVLTGLAVYLPFLQNVLGTIALPPVWLIGVLGVGACNIFAVELGKFIFNRRTY